jgi:ribosomal-protein-alanine N-acetyltransferase
MTSGEVVLVPMTSAHLDAIMPFEREMFGAEAWTRSGYQAELDDRDYRYYVAAEGADGAVLGWAGVMVIADSAQILTVGVVPDARRRGIGQALLDALLAEARRRRATAVFLEVRVDNGAAQALYARNGFTRLRVRRGYYDHGRVDGIEMQRAL